MTITNACRLDVVKFIFKELAAQLDLDETLRKAKEQFPDLTEEEKEELGMDIEWKDFPVQTVLDLLFDSFDDDGNFDDERFHEMLTETFSEAKD